MVVFLAGGAMAQTPVVTNGIPASGASGEQFTFDIGFSNGSGGPGYGPYVRLVLDPGLSLDAAQYAGTSVAVTNVGTFPAAPGNMLTDPKTGDMVTGPEGGTLLLLGLPLGSVVTGGPDIDIATTLTIDMAADIGTPLNASVQGVYEFGDTPTGDNGPIVGSSVNGQVTPTLFSVAKTNNAPEGERPPTTTHPFTYTIAVDVANGQTLFDPVVTDTLDADVQFIGPVTITGGTGGTATTTPSTITPGGTLTVTFTGITGTASATDATISFPAHIIDTLDESNGATEVKTNTVTVDGEFPDDTPLAQAMATSNVTAKHLAIQKGAAPDLASPGETITFTSNIQTTDIDTVTDLVIVDTLPDGYDTPVHTSLTVNGGPVAITPSIVTNSGVTTLTYDVTAVTGNLPPGTTATLVYTADILQTYFDTTPVLADDSLTNTIQATYDLQGGATGATDGSAATVSIRSVQLSKTVVNPQADYHPGDTVTYRLSMQIPSGDTSGVVFEDFLPLPVFDATAVNLVFGNDITTAPTDTLALTPDNITADGGTNSIRIEWPDITTTSTQTLAVDIDVTITDEPFADGLNLTNLFQASTVNSGAVATSGIAPAPILVSAPNLTVLTHGISASDNATADATISPAPSMLPVDGDITASDAGDTVTFVLTVENAGGAPAHDVTASVTTIAALTNYTLVSVLDGAGTPLTNSGDLFGAGLVLTNALDENDGNPGGGGAPYGTDTALITYTAEIATTVGPRDVLTSDGGVTWASAPSATAFPASTDDTTITIADPDVAKTVDSISPAGAGGGNITAGDVVTYRLTVTLPEGTTPGLTLTDTLPPGLDFVSATVDTTGFAGSVDTTPTTGTSGNISTTGEVVTLDFGSTTVTNDNNAGNNSFAVTLDARVLSSESVNDGLPTAQTKTNTVALSYTGFSGAAVNDTVAASFVEPDIEVTKAMSPTSGIEAGDTITVTLVVNNNGTGPVYDVVLTDTLNDGGTLFDTTTGATEGTTPGNFSFNYSSPTVTYTMTSGSIAAGGMATFTFTGVAHPNIVTGSSYTNAAAVAGSSQDGTVTGERATNDTVTSSAITTADPDTMITLSSSSETFTSDTGTIVGAIGEVLTLALTYDIPEGVTTEDGTNAILEGVLPAGFQFQTGTATIRAIADTGITGSNSGAISTFATGITPTVTGQTLGFDIGTIDNNDTDGNAEQIVILVDVLVLNTTDNNRTNTKTSTARLNYDNRDGNPQSQTDTLEVTVVEPNPMVSKGASPTTAAGGATITFTVVLTNTAGASVTRGWEPIITDTLPGDFVNPAVVSATLSRGPVDVTSSASFSGNALTVDLAGTVVASERYLDPGETVTVVYTADVSTSAAFETEIDNTAVGTFTSTPGTNGTSSATPGAPDSDTGERTGSQATNTSAQAVNDLRASDMATVTTDKPTITMSGGGMYQVGEVVTMTVQIPVPTGSTNNFVLTTDLPSGLSYTGSPITINVPGTNFSASNTPSTTPGAGSDPLVFDFGTVSNSSTSSQTISVTFDAVVDNILANQDTTMLVTTSTLNYQGATMPLPQDSQTVTVVEPNLFLSRVITAGGTGSEAGDTISFQLNVANTAANGTAYSVNLEDLLPADLLGAPDGSGVAPFFRNITLTNPADAVTLNGSSTPLAVGDATFITTTNANDTLTWPAFDIPPGASLQIAYDAVLANSAVAGASLTTTSTARYNSASDSSGRDDSDSVDDDNNAALNNQGETASVNATVGAMVSIQKTGTIVGSATSATIGADVQYDLVVGVIEGNIPSVVVTDVFPAGVDFVSLDSIIATGNISYNGAGTAVEAPAGTVTVDLGDVSNTSDGNASNDTITVRLLGRITDVVGNSEGVLLQNSGSVTTGAGNAGPDTFDFYVVEPNLVAVVTASDTTPSRGDTITMTVMVSHSSSTADAFEVNLTDVIPAGLSYVPGSTMGSATVDETDTSAPEFDLGSITLADMSKTFTFQVTVDSGATLNAPITHTLSGDYTGISGTPAVERSYSLSGSNTVTPNNEAPVITAQSAISIAEDGSRLLTLADLTVTDSDNTYPTDFTLSVLGGNNYTVNSNTIVPSPDFNGTLTVPVLVNDGNLDSNIFNLTITVPADNDAPVFETSPPLVATEDVAYGYTIDTSDVEGDVPVLTATTLPSWLMFADNGDGTASLTGTPGDGEVGNHAVVIRADDGNGGITNQTFMISVGNVQDFPRYTSTPVTAATEDTAYTYTLTATDDDGDAVSFTGTTVPSWLTLVDNMDGTATLSGTPLNGDVGDAVVIIDVDDGNGNVTPQAFTITVANDNDDPTFNSTAPTAATEDAVYTYQVRYGDVDGDTLAVTAPTLPSWLTFTDNGDGTATLTGTPPNSAVGANPVTLQLDDGNGGVVMQSFTVNVANTNDAPTFTSTPATTGMQDNPYSYTITLNDDDGDNPAITGTILPDWLTLVDNGDGTGTLTGTPDNGDVGVHAIVLAADDGNGGTAAQTFTVTVGNVEDLPQFTSTPVLTVDEDTAYTYVLRATDPDGDPLSFDDTNVPAWLTLTDNGDGTATLTGTPENGDVGDHSIVVTVDDGNGNMVPQAFTVTVNNTNDAPSFTSTPTVSATEDVAYSYTIATVDDDGNPLTINATTIPSWLTLVDNGDGTATLSGTPENDDVGSAAVILEVTDGNGGTGTQAFSIAVANADDEPVFTSTPVTNGREDEFYTYVVTATDADGDPLSFTGVTLPDWLTFTDNGDGTGVLSGLPDNDNVGVHNVVLSVNDGNGGTVQQSFAIDVANINNRPLFSSMPVTEGLEDAVYTYMVETTDPDGDVPTLTAPRIPAWLTFTDNGDRTGTLTGTPTNAEVGYHIVILEANDGNGGVTPQVFVVEVGNTSDLPRFTSMPVTTVVEDDAYTYAVTGVDDDGSPVTFSADTLPPWLMLVDNGDGTAVLSGIPDNGDVGPHVVILDITDGDGNTTPQAFVVTVNNSADAPQFTSTPVTTGTQDEPYTYNFTALDPDGGMLTFVPETLPDWLTFVDNGDGTGSLTGTPDNGDVGRQVIVIEVVDEDGNRMPQVFTIDVGNVNDDPVFTSTPPGNTPAGDEYVHLLTTSDPDGDIPTFSTDGLPDWVMFVDNGNGTATLTGRPDTGDIGDYSFDVTIDDGNGGTEVQTVTISVDPLPDGDMDGIPDRVEGNGDEDGDGIPNDQDDDSDGDGISDLDEGFGDTDHDGIPDFLDTDTDGDGISDEVEGAGDPDMDGRQNYRDTDSDGDGIGDFIEGTEDTDEDGTPNFLDTDSDDDGIPDSLEGSGDQDGDGVPNYLDDDSDNDGRSDTEEGSMDTDGDGLPDYLDTDTDGDGIPDRVEGTGDPDGDGVPNVLDLDSDGDTIPDQAEGDGDQDGDGIPNFLDTDSDDDGISDEAEGDGDSDGDGLRDFLDRDSDDDGVGDDMEGAGDFDEDGVPDYLDEDSDNDGVDDLDEGPGDQDNDGMPNRRDEDSDNDGIPDGTEGTGDDDGDGIPNFLDDDQDNDGIPDSIEGNEDPDGDGIPNSMDDDSDGDGIPDADEGAGDQDGDGIRDFLDEDADNDGIPDRVEGPGDFDEDGLPDRLDLDSDEDGIYDAIEGVDDPDEDGMPNYLDDDADDDTIPDATEGHDDRDADGLDNFVDDDSDGDGIPDAVEGTVDTDEDGVPNFLDLDSDNDGIPDAIEGTDDADGDGIPNYLDLDSDGDGIPDSEEGYGDRDGDGILDFLDLDTDGDGIPDSVEGSVDSDLDGIPDYRDLDSDDDGIPDSIEGTGDPDGDGVPNYLDDDSDGDGVLDRIEGFTDIDNDGAPNFLDVDSDDDGVDDGTEQEQGTDPYGMGENPLPVAPDHIHATDGLFVFKVVVRWKPVENADRYHVYRSSTDNFETAELAHTVQWPVFIDIIHGQERIHGGFGCEAFNRNGYYYWVVAENEFGRSAATPSDRGYPGLIGIVGLEFLDEIVFEDLIRVVQVFPYSVGILPDGISHIASPAIRFQLDEPADAVRIFNEVWLDGVLFEGGIWQSIPGRSNLDGWMVYRSDRPFPAGASLTMSAWAETDAGAIVAAEPQEFVVSEEAFDASEASLMPEGGAEVYVKAFDQQKAEGLQVGVGAVHEVGPMEVFAEPALAWLAVPEEVDPETLGLYVALPDEEGSGWQWYPAESVDGLLGPESYIIDEHEGTTWLGFTLYHGAMVQLAPGAFPGGETQGAAAVPAAPGDWMVLALLVLLLMGGWGVVSRRYAHRS